MLFRNPRAWVLIPGFVILVGVLGLVHGSTTANSIPPSRAGISYHPATAQQLAPPECAGMALTSFVWQDNGTLHGTEGNDLLVGSDNTPRINGGGGNDCLVIGSRTNNRLDGGSGNNVCIGNPTTRFENCAVVIIRGVAPAGFTPMELAPPTPEVAETNGIPDSEGTPEGLPEGLDESPESAPVDAPDGEGTEPEADPAVEPEAESEAAPEGGNGLEEGSSTADR